MDAVVLIMEAVGWMLVHFLWQGMVVAGLVWAALRVLGRAGPSWRYAAAMVGLGAMVVVAGATLVRHWPSMGRAAAEVRGAMPSFSESPEVPQPPASMVTLEEEEGASREAPVGPVGFNAPSPPMTWRPSTVAASLRPWFPWMVGGWALGVMGCLIRLSHGWWWLSRIRRTGQPVTGGRWTERLAEMAGALQVGRAVRLVRSATARGPMVVGWLKPVVILPAALLAGLPPAQIEAILAHELAHIRRHDYLVNWLQCLVEALFFYHPAVWWVSAQLRREREHCCDDIASRFCGGPLPYARALSALEEWRGAESLLGVAAAGHPLLQRIRRLLGVNETPSFGWPAAVTALAATVLLPLGVAWAGAKPGDPAPQAAHVSDGGWSSYCVHAGGEAQFVFLAKGDFSSTTRSRHNPAERTWSDEATLSFPDGRELRFHRSSDAPDALKVEDMQPNARSRFERTAPADQDPLHPKNAGIQTLLQMPLGFLNPFSIGKSSAHVGVRDFQQSGTVSLAKGRILLLDAEGCGLHQLNLPARPVTSVDALAVVRHAVEMAATAVATTLHGEWGLPGGVKLQLIGDVFHATDVMTSALLSWPARDGRPAHQWHTGIASDAFANREKWAVAWDTQKPVLWIASRDIASAAQTDDGRPVANRFKRVDFSDPSNIREEYFQHGWPADEMPPSAVVSRLSQYMEVPAGGARSAVLHSWAFHGSAEKIDWASVQNIHLTLHPDASLTVELAGLEKSVPLESLAAALASLRAEWTRSRHESLAGKTVVPRVTFSAPSGTQPATIERIRTACREAGCGPFAAGSTRGAGGVRRFVSGVHHGLVLEPVGVPPIFLIAAKEFSFAADSSSFQGTLTFPVATSAKELRLGFSWDPGRPRWLGLRNDNREDQINDLGRGRVIWATFDRHEFGASVYQVPGDAGTGTDEKSLAAVVDRAQSWWQAADDREKWEQSRVHVPDSGYSSGKPLDASTETIRWGVPNELGLRLGLGGMTPGETIAAGQPLPIKQYVANGGTETVRLSPTGPFNEGLEAELVRADGARIPHVATYRWPMPAIRARLEPGHFIELQSRPMQTVLANPDGSASGSLTRFDSGFIVKPGQYVLQLVHHVGRFHGVPVNTFAGDPSIAPGLGEWTGRLRAPNLPLHITEPRIGTATPGEVREYRSLDRIQFKQDRLVLSHPAPGKTGTHSYVVGPDGDWPTRAGEWKTVQPDQGYLAAWDEGNRRLWYVQGPLVQKLDFTDGSFRNAGTWPVTTPPEGYGDMPAGVHEALGLPRAQAAAPTPSPADNPGSEGTKIAKPQTRFLSLGPPRADGLRAALVLDPQRKEYHIGEIVRCAVWFFNDGPAPITFTTDARHQWNSGNVSRSDRAGAWPQIDLWNARRSAGRPTDDPAVWSEGATPQVTVTLAPGEARQIPVYGFGNGRSGEVGANSGMEIGADVWAETGEEVSCVQEVGVSPGENGRLRTGPVTFRIKPAPTNDTPPPTSPVNEPATNADGLSEVHAIQLATEAALAFFRSDDLEKRLRLLDTPEEDRDAVAKFFQRHPLPADPAAAVTGHASGTPMPAMAQRAADGTWTVKLAIDTPKTGRNHFVSVGLVGEKARLEWEISTVFQSGLYDELAEGIPGDERTILASVKRGDYFNFAFADASRFACYELSHPLVDKKFFGYVEKDSPLDQALSAVVDGPWARQMPLKVAVPEGEHDDRQLIILAAPEASASEGQKPTPSGK